MKIIARFSGVVTYTDGGTQSFSAHLDDQGRLAVNYATEGVKALYHVLNDQNWVENMISQLSGTVSLSPASDPVRGAVSDLTCELSGRVAYDNQTWGDFIVQYTHQSGQFIPTGGSATHWTNARANSAALASLVTLFKAAASTTGTSGATVA